MTMPATPKEQMDVALSEAWAAAEQCKLLLEGNDHSFAVAWASSAQAWAAVASTVATRLRQ
jgi:hypothetical protein